MSEDTKTRALVVLERMGHQEEAVLKYDWHGCHLGLLTTARDWDYPIELLEDSPVVAARWVELSESVGLSITHLRDEIERVANALLPDVCAVGAARTQTTLTDEGGFPVCGLDLELSAGDLNEW